MPVQFTPTQIRRLKERARTISRVQKLSSTMAHDVVAKENGFSCWSELSRKNNPIAEISRQDHRKQVEIAIHNLSPSETIQISRHLLQHYSLPQTRQYAKTRHSTDILKSSERALSIGTSRKRWK